MPPPTHPSRSTHSGADVMQQCTRNTCDHVRKRRAPTPAPHSPARLLRRRVAGRIRAVMHRCTSRLLFSPSFKSLQRERLRIIFWLRHGHRGPHLLHTLYPIFERATRAPSPRWPFPPLPVPPKMPKTEPNSILRAYSIVLVIHRAPSRTQRREETPVVPSAVSGPEDLTTDNGARPVRRADPE